MTSSQVSQYRRSVNRCTSRRVELRLKPNDETRKDSWRCDLMVEHSGEHQSHSGHRTWADDDLFHDYRTPELQVDVPDDLIEDVESEDIVSPWVVAQLAAFEQVISALVFYADPEIYDGIVIRPIRPCGEFADDLSEPEDPPYPEHLERPGKRAREALEAWAVATHPMV